MTASEFDDISDDMPLRAGETAQRFRRSWNTIAGDVLGAVWIGGLTLAAGAIGLAGRRRSTASTGVRAARTVSAGR